MSQAKASARQQTLSEALQQLQSALRSLDGARAPAHIGAHVDLAIHALYDLIVAESGNGRIDQMTRNAAFQ